MRNFFLMNYKTAFIWIMFLGVPVLGVVLIVGAYGDWQKAIFHYNLMTLNSPPYQKDICGHIDEFLSTKDGVRVIKGMLRDRWSKSPLLHEECISDFGRVLKLSDEEWLSAKHKVNTDNPFDDLLSDKTMIEEATNCVAGCKNSSLKKTDGFIAYTLNRMDHISLIAGYLLITAPLFCLYLIGRMFFKEPNLGWRRLSIVAACIMGGIVPAIYFYDDRIKYPDVFFISFAALIGTFSAMLFGRKIYFWVKAGFHEEGHAQQLSETAKRQGAPRSEVIIADSAIRDAYSKATYWPRFWARCIDMPLIWVLGSMIASLAPNFRKLFPTTTGILIDLIVGLAFVCATFLVYETLCISQFGRTLGKLIFGLRVRNTDGHLPTWREAWQRSLEFLESGVYFMLFFPWLQMVGATLAWKRKQQRMVWDVLSKTHVEQHKINIIRYAVSAIIAILLISMMGVAEIALKGNTKRSLHSLYFSSYRSHPNQQAFALNAGRVGS